VSILFDEDLLTKSPDKGSISALLAEDQRDLGEVARICLGITNKIILGICG